MGKYLIRVESMDHDEVFNKAYSRGFECDGFVIMADKGDDVAVAMHHVSIDNISDMIAHESTLAQAAILADAKRRITEIARKDDMAEKCEALKKVLGMD
jgi:hypothetical protein